MDSNNIQRVKRNIDSMINQGASEQEIDIYIGGEGVTVNMLNTNPDTRSIWDRMISGAKNIVSPEAEDFPEVFPNQVLGSFQKADTPEGQLNILNRSRTVMGKTPMSLSKDKFNNDIVIDSDGRKHFLNKPGASLNDFNLFFEGLEKYAPLIVGGSVSAPMKTLAGMGTAGLTGSISEGMGQTSSNIAGSNEGYDLNNIIETGSYSALGEGAGRGLSWALGKIMSRFGSKTDDLSQFVNPDGKLTPKTIEILERKNISPQDLDDLLLKELNKDGVLTAKEAQRFNTLKDQAIEPTKAQVTRNADDFQFQQEMAKNSNPMRSRLDSQNSQVLKNHESLIEQTGRSEIGKENTGNSFINAVIKKAEDHDALISNLYKQAKEASPAAMNIKLSGLAKSIRDNGHNNQFTRGLPKAIYGELQTRGIISQDGKLIGKINVETAEEIRKILNTYHDPANPFGNKLIRTFKDQLDDDVLKIAGNDIFKQARKAKTDFHKEFTNARLNKFDTKRKNVLEKILDGTIEPDKAFQKIIKSGSIRDIETLKNTLLNGSGEQVTRGMQAWNDVRGQVLQEAFEKATKSAAKSTLDEPIFNAKTFKDAMNSLGSKRKTLFSDVELETIEQLAKADSLRTPVALTGIGEGPTGVAINKLLSVSTTGRAALAANEAIKKGSEATLNAQRMSNALDPSKMTLKAFKAYMESLSRGTRLLPRVTGLGGAVESNR